MTLPNPAIREKEKEYSIYNTIKNKSSYLSAVNKKRKGILYNYSIERITYRVEYNYIYRIL